jgi:hypothetical protein
VPACLRGGQRRRLHNMNEGWASMAKTAGLDVSCRRGPGAGLPSSHDCALPDATQFRGTRVPASPRRLLWCPLACQACTTAQHPSNFATGACIHTHAHTHAHAYTHTHSHTHSHTHAHTYTHAHTRSRTHVYTHTHIHTHTPTHTPGVAQGHGGLEDTLAAPQAILKGRDVVVHADGGCGAGIGVLHHLRQHLGAG